jgi:hypothetical protein
MNEVTEITVEEMRAMVATRPTMSEPTRDAILRFGSVFQTAEGKRYRCPRTDFSDGPTHRTEFPIVAAVPLDPYGSN